MELTQEIVRELLDYDPETGILTWKERDVKWFKSEHASKVWNTRYANKEAFTYINKSGHKQGAIFYVNYFSHQIIWLWMTGEWSSEDIDHINGLPFDNRFSNLRHVSHEDNCRNQKLRNTNKSGINGVCWCKNRKRWLASVTINGKTRIIKRCHTKEEATELANEAREKLNYHKNHGKRC